MADDTRRHFEEMALELAQQAYKQSEQFKIDTDRLMSEAAKQDTSDEERAADDRRKRAGLRGSKSRDARDRSMRHFEKPNSGNLPIKIRESTRDEISNLGASFKVHEVETAPAALIDKVLRKMKAWDEPPFRDAKSDKMEWLMRAMKRPSATWYEGMGRIHQLPWKYQNEVWRRLVDCLKDAVVCLQCELLTFKLDQNAINDIQHGIRQVTEAAN